LPLQWRAVTRSNLPFHPRFWQTACDARPLAVLRIGLGLLVLADLVDRLRDFHAFYTTLGLAPHPAASLQSLARWSLLGLSANPTVTLVLYLLGFPLALAFALGYRTRLANVLLWLFVVSLHHRNPHLNAGGDSVLAALLFWSMFADTGAQGSLDVQLGRRPALELVPGYPVRFLQLQVAFIYLVSCLAKTGPSWRDGTAILRALQVSDWDRGLAPVLLAFPALCTVLTFGTLAVEGLFPLLVFSPWRARACRVAALAGGVGLHLGIFLTMRVGVFSQVMLLSYLPFWPGADGREPATPLSRRQRRLVLVMGLQLALIIGGQLTTATGRPLPRPLFAELAALGLGQDWRMFSPDAPRYEVRWRAMGTLGDGRTLDLVPEVIPGLGEHHGFFYSRWLRLRNALTNQPPDLIQALGRYVCRRWNGERTPPLISFELVADAKTLPGVVFAPGELLPASQVRLRQGCHHGTTSKRSPDPFR
jgi:hypothetical protein